MKIGFMRLDARAAVLLCASAVCSPASGADVFRWVDESGRTHFSNTVPDKYKKSAVKIETRQSEPTAQQRREAEERASADRRRIKANEDSKAATPSSRPVDPVESESTAAERKPPDDLAADCETQHRIYRESLACFAPFTLANGAIRAEAFQVCKVVRDPGFHCGPLRDRSSSERF